MQLEELYGIIGGDFENAKAIMTREERIEKYLKLFLKEESFGVLKKAFEEDNMEEAFKACHTLKGICANMSFTKLETLSKQITEDLRHMENVEDAKATFPKLREQYDLIITNINKYFEEKGN